MIFNIILNIIQLIGHNGLTNRSTFSTPRCLCVRKPEHLSRNRLDLVFNQKNCYFLRSYRQHPEGLRFAATRGSSSDPKVDRTLIDRQRTKLIRLNNNALVDNQHNVSRGCSLPRGRGRKRKPSTSRLYQKKCPHSLPQGICCG